MKTPGLDELSLFNLRVVTVLSRTFQAGDRRVVLRARRPFSGNAWASTGGRTQRLDHPELDGITKRWWEKLGRVKGAICTLMHAHVGP